MLIQFLHFIKKNKLFRPKEQILIAVSGGMDSVVLAELFHRAKFNFAIAHCNFQLRGKESDGDEKLVKELAERYGVNFFTKRFNTSKEADQKKISIQMAARDSRYQWFEEVLNTKGYDYVATAHHLNDSIETFFINLVRGTGIEGITGIDAKVGNIIRPLLFATRYEIEEFTIENKIQYREDSSNLSDDYLRNKIRHHLVPVFNSLNPKFEETMEDNISHFSFAAKIFRKQVTEQTAKLFRKEKDFFSISMKELNKRENAGQFLYEILRPFGFNYIQCVEILNENILTKSGKKFLTNNFRVVRDRDKILLDSVNLKADHDFLITKTKKKTLTPFFELQTSFAGKKRNPNFPSSETEQWIDAGLLKFPLTVRRWEAGDSFFPLGMKHHKKLSDFFIDNKVNLIDKENTYVLVSGNKIVCILGHRIDDRFKVTDKTIKIYKIIIKYR